MKVFNWIKKNGWLTAILVLGGFLRFYHIDYQSVWLDEIHTINEANPNVSLSEVYNAITSGEQMPPLYFYTVYFLFKLFGYTTLVVRSYSAVLGIISLYALYILGKELISKEVGLMASLLLSINYFHLFHSQESRPYIFLLVFATLAFYRLVLYLKNPILKNALYFSLFSSLMIHSHFFGLFTLVSQYVILFIFLLVSEKENRLNFFKNCLISGGLTIISYLPVIPIFIKISKISTFWIQPPTADAYTLILSEFFGNSEMVLTLIGIVSVFYFLQISKEKDFPLRYTSLIENKFVFSFLILIPWLVIVVLIPLIRSYTSVPMIISRYFIVTLPAIMLLISIGITQFNNKIIRVTFLSLFVVFSLTDIIIVKKYYKTVNKTQFREVTEFIIKNNSNNHPVVTSLPWYFPYFLNNETVKTDIVDKTLQDYVNEMIQDSTKRKPFWYVDAHNLPYNVSETTQKYLDDNFIVENNIDLYDTWAKHYVKSSNSLTVIDVSKFKSLKTVNGDIISSSIEVFDNSQDVILISGWAYLNEQDAKNSVIAIVAVNEQNLVYKISTQKIKREDVTTYFKSSFDLSNSGFSAKVILKKFKPGNYRIGILVKNSESKKEGLVITDKYFVK